MSASYRLPLCASGSWGENRPGSDGLNRALYQGLRAAASGSSGSSRKVYIAFIYMVIIIFSRITFLKTRTTRTLTKIPAAFQGFRPRPGSDATRTRPGRLRFAALALDITGGDGVRRLGLATEGTTYMAKGIERDRNPKTRERRLRLYPLCGPCLEAGRTTPTEEIDHVIELELGGPDTDENCQGICRPCHVAKTNKNIYGHKSYGLDGWPI